jgi:hypothetical protein
MSLICDKGPITARKQHRCWYCNQTIEAGEKHGVRVGASYGDFWAMRFHPECDQYAHDQHWDEGDYECHEPGDFTRPITAFDPVI